MKSMITDLAKAKGVYYLNGDLNYVVGKLISKGLDTETHLKVMKEWLVTKPSPALVIKRLNSLVGQFKKHGSTYKHLASIKFIQDHIVYENDMVTTISVDKEVSKIEELLVHEKKFYNVLAEIGFKMDSKFKVKHRSMSVIDGKTSQYGANLWRHDLVDLPIVFLNYGHTHVSHYFTAPSTPDYIQGKTDLMPFDDYLVYLKGIVSLKLKVKIDKFSKRLNTIDLI